MLGAKNVAIVQSALMAIDHMSATNVWSKVILLTMLTEASKRGLASQVMKMSEHKTGVRNVVQQAMIESANVWVVTNLASSEERPVSWRNPNVFVTASGELIDIRDVLVIRFAGEKK